MIFLLTVFGVCEFIIDYFNHFSFFNLVTQKLLSDEINHREYSVQHNKRSIAVTTHRATVSHNLSAGFCLIDQTCI